MNNGDDDRSGVPFWRRSLYHGVKVPGREGATTSQLRKHAKERLDCLPPDKVRVAAEFLDYLDTAANRDATAELLKMPALLQDVEDASEHIKRGRFKDWRKVRKEDYDDLRDPLCDVKKELGL